MKLDIKELAAQVRNLEASLRIQGSLDVEMLVDPLKDKWWMCQRTHRLCKVVSVYPETLKILEVYDDASYIREINRSLFEENIAGGEEIEVLMSKKMLERIPSVNN